MFFARQALRLSTAVYIPKFAKHAKPSGATRIEFLRLSFLSRLIAVLRRWLVLHHLADITQRLPFERTISA